MRPVKGGLHAVKSVLGCDYHTHDDGRRPFLVLELEWEEIVNDAHSVTFEPFDGEGISALPCVKAYMQLSAIKTKIKKLQSQAMFIYRRKKDCDAFLAAQVHEFSLNLIVPTWVRLVILFSPIFLCSRRLHGNQMEPVR
jgi:hypothetical protein